MKNVGARNEIEINSLYSIMGGLNLIGVSYDNAISRFHLRKKENIDFPN